MKSALSKFAALALVGIVLIYVISGSLVPRSKSSGSVEHFSTSLDLANQATSISNKVDGLEHIPESDVYEIIRLHQKSLGESKFVNIDELNNRLSGFGDNYRDEFILGSKLFLNGLESGNAVQAIRGQILLRKFGYWYRKNISEIRKK